MDWIARVRNAEKTSLVQDGKRKVHYKFQDGEEMAEEYNLDTNVILRRAWKRGNNLSKKNQWEIEVGDPDPDTSSLDTIGLKENCNTPYVIKRITSTALEWRIRNLSYPIEVYSVLADPDSKCIIVKTSNKKYYKKITVPELERVNLAPDQKRIEYTYKFGTLIITYKKPPEVLKLERQVLEELQNVQTIKDGDLPCKPS
ncbi:protein DPCD [Halyomorpha halys]|uniref:protein DPCD n=1 Tax=Halyomorpha halys TaxID=286706 RepID=UPI0006D4EAD5|nr:protein DPCD [Halyomorpha halys]